MKKVRALIELMLTASILMACGRSSDMGNVFETEPVDSSESIIESEEADNFFGELASAHTYIEGKEDVEIIVLSGKENLEVLLKFDVSIEDVAFISPSGKMYSRKLGNIEEIDFASYPNEFVPETMYVREDSSAENSMIYYAPDAEAGTWKIRCALTEGNSVECTAYPIK